MRDYQRSCHNKYILPKAIYHKTLWTIRDYYRLCESLEDIADTSKGISYEAPKVQSSNQSDTTFVAAVKLSKNKEIINAIDKARKNIPPEYRAGVWDNILFDSSFPKDANRSTYGRAKSKFIYDVARFLDYI